MAICLTWSLYTGHVWEDYYITFRSSKNLATGHGLVFNEGDRLHTFTSPLGVLLPAAASGLTGNTSDKAALWIFRLWSVAAFALATVLVWRTLAWRGGAAAVFGASCAAAWLAIDAKSVDFTTNGMETGLLLMFLAYAIWAMFGPRAGDWRHVGAAWAGLMWTRPDSFIYVALLALGALAFREEGDSPRGFWATVAMFLKAGALCMVLYLPWFAWAWWYYGSPVPHTVVAKGVVSGEESLAGLAMTALRLPLDGWQGRTSLEGAFLASYYQIGGWPEKVVQAARAVAVIVALQWLLPWQRVVRAASLVFFGMHVYLTYFPFFPFPWYLPGTTILALIVLGGMAATAWAWARRLGERRPQAGKWTAGAVAGLVVVATAAQGWLSWQMMRQMKVEQELSANAVRRATGEWLRAHAKPGDTVFMEPLGHIAYFSGLRTLDWPGLSSREVVRARSFLGNDWGLLADYLCPDWMVFRPWEIARITGSVPRLFLETYEWAAEFNTLDQVAKADIYGKGYIAHDARWVVFRRKKPKRHQIDVMDPAVRANYPLPPELFYGKVAYKLHAAGVMSVRVPPGARRVSINYGLPEGTFTGPLKTHGASFWIIFVDDRDQAKDLLKVFLDPEKRPEDRGAQVLTAELPETRRGELVLLCLPHESDQMDWTCWSIPEFGF